MENILSVSNIFLNIFYRGPVHISAGFYTKYFFISEYFRKTYVSVAFF